MYGLKKGFGEVDFLVKIFKLKLFLKRFYDMDFDRIFG